MTMGRERMSASGIKKFADCPKQWWFRYLSDHEAEEGETKYMDLGSAVHDAIEECLKTGQTDPDEEAHLFYHYADYHGVPDDMLQTGEDCFRRALEYVQKRDPEIIGVEDEIRFTIDRPDVQSDVLAYIDVATSDEIWDWKTGSIRDDTPQKEQIQAAVYVAAYRVEYGHFPEMVRFVYLKEEKVRSIEPSQDIANTMLANARAIVQARKRNEFPAKPGDKCHWCGYQMHCPESGVGVGDFDWNKYMGKV